MYSPGEIIVATHTVYDESGIKILAQQNYRVVSTEVTMTRTLLKLNYNGRIIERCDASYFYSYREAFSFATELKEILIENSIELLPLN